MMRYFPVLLVVTGLAVAAAGLSCSPTQKVVYARTGLAWMQRLTIRKHQIENPDWFNEVRSRAAAGDSESIVTYTFYADLSQLDARSSEEAATELLKIVNDQIAATQTREGAIYELGHLRNSQLARDGLCKIANDSQGYIELRRKAVDAIASQVRGFLNSGGITLAQRTITQAERKTILTFLLSSDEENRSAAVSTIDFGDIHTLFNDLLHTYSLEKSPAIRASIISAIGASAQPNQSKSLLNAADAAPVADSNAWKQTLTKFLKDNREQMPQSDVARLQNRINRK